MNTILKNKIIEVCDRKIETKGTNVSLSFYAFFANKNDNPQMSMKAVEWWISTHKLDHLEKDAKINKMAQDL